MMSSRGYDKQACQHFKPLVFTGREKTCSSRKYVEMPLQTGGHQTV